MKFSKKQEWKLLQKQIKKQFPAVYDQTNGYFYFELPALKDLKKKKEAWFVGKEEGLRDELFKVSGLADLSVSELKEMMSKL